MKKIRRAAGLLTFLFCFVAMVSARAQPPFVVGVGFEFDAPSMARPWTAAAVKDLTAEIHDYLTSYLNDEFLARHPAGELWRFSPEGSQRWAALKAEIVEDLFGSVWFRVTPYVDGRVDLDDDGLFPLEIEWYKPGDAVSRGRPGRAQALEQIKATVGRLFQDRRIQTAVERWLYNRAPITHGAQWNNPMDPQNLWIVLPLSWQDYKFLRSSTFRLSCSMPNQGDFDLDSRASGTYGPFHPPNGPPYEALIVSPTPSSSTPIAEIDPQERPNLTFGAVYLTKFHPPQFAVAPGGGQS